MKYMIDAVRVIKPDWFSNKLQVVTFEDDVLPTVALCRKLLAKIAI